MGTESTNWDELVSQNMWGASLLKMHAAAIARSFVNIFFMTFFFQRFNMDVRKKASLVRASQWKLINVLVSASLVAIHATKLQDAIRLALWWYVLVSRCGSCVNSKWRQSDSGSTLRTTVSHYCVVPRTPGGVDSYRPTTQILSS